MTILAILAVIVGAVLAIVALLAFDEHVMNRYGHQFFTLSAFAAFIVAAGCILGGRRWWRTSPTDGALLFVIGAVVVVVLVARNLRRTGFVMGTCGSILQASVFGVVGYVGLLVLAVGLLILLLTLCSAKPVWVINRRW